MPDSHNVMCESRLYDGLALDGVSGEIERNPPLAKGNTPKVRRGMNLSPCGPTHRGRRLPGGDLSADLNQNQIGQRNQGRCDAARDQGVVGADVGRPFCEASHIPPIFLCGMVVRNGLVTSGLVTTACRDAGLGKTSDWPSTAVMARGRRPQIMAVDAG